MTLPNQHLYYGQDKTRTNRYFIPRSLAPPHMMAAANLGPRVMASLTDMKNTDYNRANNGYGNANDMYAGHYGAGGQTGQIYGTHNPAVDLAALAHSFQGMNMQNHAFANQAKNGMMSQAGQNYNGLAMANSSMPSQLYGNGQYGFPSNYGGNGNMNVHKPNMYTPNAQHYMPHLGYHQYQHHEHSPLSQNWTPTTANGGEVPTLITPRRGSVSSNENDQPATPSYANYPGFVQGGVAINRSPNGFHAHSTPSPTSMMGPYGVKMPDQGDVSPRIKMLVNCDPPIPHAIPAPSSPLKALDRALENQRGETNVYIRGLLPQTTDEMLEGWGSRFGDIKSSKSIIDLNTGHCKGFGFVKYHNYEDAENCIRGFHYLGYEVSFARESFYSKLKTFADDHNTNLYVSNLPKSMNEHELAQLFAPHKVASSRILRNNKDGTGRGVGFARFESRDACEEVIRTFNNHTIKSGTEELQIQIRYADTQEQKSLKQQTQAARQFRSAEYEFAMQAWRHGRLAVGPASSNGDTSSVNEFEQYMGAAAGGAPLAHRAGPNRYVPGRSPLGALPYTAAAQSPVVQVNVNTGTNDAKPAENDSNVTSPVSPIVKQESDSKCATPVANKE